MFQGRRKHLHGQNPFLDSLVILWCRFRSRLVARVKKLRKPSVARRSPGRRSRSVFEAAKANCPTTPQRMAPSLSMMELQCPSYLSITTIQNSTASIALCSTIRMTVRLLHWQCTLVAFSFRSVSTRELRFGIWSTLVILRN